MNYPYQRYRFTRKDGTTTFESIPANVDLVEHVKKLMRQHGAAKAEPVEPTKGDPIEEAA